MPVPREFGVVTAFLCGEYFTTEALGQSRMPFCSVAKHLGSRPMTDRLVFAVRLITQNGGRR